MVTCKLGKSTQEYAARSQLADYLRSIGEVLVAANTRAAAMCGRAHEHWESQNGRRAERTQVFCFPLYALYFILLNTTPTAGLGYFSG